MSVLFILIPVSLVFATAFLAVFFWAVRSGQFEDTCTPSMRLLMDDEVPATPSRNATHATRGNGSGGRTDSGTQALRTQKTLSNNED